MPKFRAATVDEYVGKRSMVSRDGMVYRAAKMPKSFNPEERSGVFVMTDETVDSYGDIVKAGGADLYRFEKNPIALLNHRSDLILGTWSDVAKKPQRLEGKVTLADAGTAPHIDMAFGLMSQGILKGASIGFMPTKLEMRLDDDGDPTWCYIIHEWELYECSVVSIPANPSALARSAANSDELAIARDYIEQVLDSWVKSPEGLILPRSEFEAAYTVVVEKLAEDNVPAAPTIDVKNGPIVIVEPPSVGPSTEDVDAFVAKAIEADAVLEENDAGFKAHAGGEVVAELATGLAGVALHIDIIERVKTGKAAKSAELAEDPPATVVEDKPETPAPVVVTLEADTSQIDAAVEKVEGLFTRLAKKFPMFFPKAIEERIEPTIVPSDPPAPPTTEEIAAARAKAAGIRERLAGKGLIAA